MFSTWYEVYVNVTVTENTASGPPISGVTVQGRWSGAYNANVSGTTNANGQVGWKTEWVGGGAWVTFTVNKITIGSNEYDLGGTLSASIKAG